MISLDIEKDCHVETWNINFYGNGMFKYIFLTQLLHKEADSNDH